MRKAPQTVEPGFDQVKRRQKVGGMAPQMLAVVFEVLKFSDFRRLAVWYVWATIQVSGPCKQQFAYS